MTANKRSFLSFVKFVHALYLFGTVWYNGVNLQTKRGLKMKNTKTCPKCANIDIVRFDGFTGSYGAGNNVMIGNTIFSAVNVNRYVCCNCGFSEEWIDKEDLEKIRKSKKAKR